TEPYDQKPAIAVSGSDIYVAWLRLHVPSDTSWLLTYDAMQVNVAQASGGSWVSVAGSYEPLGISSAAAGGEERASEIDMIINPNSGYPMVSWVAGSVSNSIFLKEYDGSAWVGVDNSDVAPGIPTISGSHSKASLAADSFGSPAVAFANQGDDGTNYVYTFMVDPSNPPAPPLFGGLKVARAETNGGNFVYLEWQDAQPPYTSEIYTNITYHIYRSTRTSWVFADTPIFSEDDVFVSGVYLGSTTIPVSATTNSFLWPVPAADLNKVWGFGVRAESPFNGLIDSNPSIRYAGVSNFVGVSDLPNNDTDGDGLDNAVDPNPTNPDADGDGLNDGHELQLGLDPLVVNVLRDEVLTGNDVSFEGANAWTHTSPLDLWHMTTAEPGSASDHSGPTSFRCAKDV
ncbi:hypothetical protein BVX97_00370, partial [bacterium E08(2017)]